MAFPKKELFRIDQQLLSGRCQALSHPARLMILELLRDEPRHVRDLAKIMPIVQGTISSHLEILRRVGFLKVKVNGRYNRYSLNIAAIEQYRIDLQEFMAGVVERSCGGAV